MAESTPPKTGGLWARLFGMTAAEEEKPEAQEQATAEELRLTPQAGNTDSADLLLASSTDGTPATPELVTPVVTALEFSEAATETTATVAEEEASFLDEQALSEAPTQVPLVPEPPLPPPTAAPTVAPTAATQLCQACGTPRKPKLNFCDDCGWMFPAVGAPPTFVVAAPAITTTNSFRAETMPTAVKIRIKDRYELGDLISERQNVCRYRGIDHGRGGQAVVIVWANSPQTAESIEDMPVALLDDEIMPGFDEPLPIAKPIEAAPATGGSAWPSLAWEKDLLDKADHPSLPGVLDAFVENNFEYLVEELPQGRSLWDAWDEPDADANVRYGWLQQIAQGMQALHNAGGILEGIRPDLIVVTAQGQAMVADVSDLLPLPLPQYPPIRATLYTAPELILSPQQADARATLFSFGATLYSLEYLHHALEEKDFEHQFSAKQITDRYPDTHPLLVRLINKTFVRDPNMRFPTDEAMKTDPSGLTELIRSFEVCRRTFDNVRLDIAAWTTTGMVRTGNEDAFAVLHGVEARQDDLLEYALILLCDGMGGYEAGEVAAAMAIAEMRKYLLGQPMFAALAGKEPPGTPINVKAYQDTLLATLKHANKEVYAAARIPGKGRRGMGCTAECVYVDSGNVIVGHVGDSRTYHLSQGRMIQLTRDQTLVNRLVELGQLTPAEAENHPRKNELQQAIGGQSDVTPNTYSARLKRGDWVLVCSDGLTNHVPTGDLEKMLTREAAYSAEEAARRLLNLVNLRGATDNATIIVIRAN